MNAEFVGLCHECGWESKPTTSPRRAEYALRKHSCERHRAKLARAQRHAQSMASIDRTPKTCHHKEADHEHGTYACYTLDGCRCTPCAKAVSEYERRRIRQHAYGRWDGLIDAEPTRAHINELTANSMGLKTIAKLSGVSHGTLWKLMYGKRHPDGTRTPSQRVTKNTEHRILALDVTLAGGMPTEQTGTTRRVQALIAMGWSASKIAERLGIERSNFSPIMFGHRRVRESTRLAVAQLYDELWNVTPPRAEHYDKIAYHRALNYARKRGWAPPMAWDDDTIDDPSATPIGAGAQRSSKMQQLDDMLDLGCFTAVDIEHKLASTKNTLAIMARRLGRSDDLKQLYQQAAS